MSIESELLRLSKSPAFQQRVRAEYEAAKKAGRAFGTQATAPGIGSFTLGPDSEESRKTVDMVLKRIRSVIETRFPYIDAKLFRVYGPFTAQDGRDEYRVFFEPAAVHRESLYNEGYPDGLENIILLYSKGGKPNKHAVYEHGIVRGRSNKYVSFNRGLYLSKGYTVHPDPFLRNGIAAINAEMAKDGITVVLHPAYYP